MNIEALEAALVSKQEISGTKATGNSNGSGNSTLKEASSNYSWLNELQLLVSGGTDFASSLYGDASGLDFSRDNSGWRSGKFSFLNNISTDAISNTAVCSRYSNSSALNGELQKKYNNAISGVTSTLETQLKSAKDQLAKLEAEQKALQIEFDSGYDRNTGKRLNSKSREALQSKIDGYSRQISMQKATISDLETKIATAKS